MKKEFSSSVALNPLFLALFLGLILWGADPGDVQAQSEIARFFSPEIGLLKTRLDFQATPYKKEDVTSQSKDFRMTHYNAFLMLPLVQDRNEEWSLIGTFRGQDIRTEVILPDTKKGFPDGLWDVRWGPSYRHRFESGWIGGGFLTLGSASDRPFASMEETELQATAFARIPDGERNAWVVLLTYSNNREFLNNVPLPGIAYWYEPSNRYRILIGFPFASIEYKPYKDVSMEFSYFPIRSVRARVSYRLLRPLLVYGGFDWRNEGYFLANRHDRWDRLFYYEKRLYAGVRWDFLKQAFLDLSSGYAFDRFYFEGSDYEDRDHNRVNVENGPYVSIQAGFRF
jgi:hypothetical protein